MIAYIILTLALLGTANAQVGETTTVTRNGATETLVIPQGILNPTGVAEDGYSSTSTLPIICNSVCWGKPAAYGICLLNVEVLNVTTGEPQTFPEGYCDDLCTPDAYNHLYECVNCLVANGGETPRASTTVSMTSPASSASGSASAPFSTRRAGPPYLPTQWPELPGDQETANAWLANLTDYCAGRDLPLESATTTVTASPTTTGPYSLRFEAGETISIPQWTELATLSDIIASDNALQRSAWLSRIDDSFGRPTGTTGEGSNGGGGAGGESAGWKLGTPVVAVTISVLAGTLIVM